METTSLPMTPRIASCSCGQLQARTAREPVRVSVCHCLACQRRTGSVFGAQARFSSEAVTIVGESVEYVRVGDEGTRSIFRFCPRCGATVYYTLEGHPESVAIPVGAFADPEFPAPTFSVYEERMHSWVNMPAGIEHMA
ncbi:GFA family protein [Sorangium sp. So ce302]